jgi:hypothetical protein
MDLQILYNNPSHEKRKSKKHKRTHVKENTMAKLRKKKNPRTVYKRDDSVTKLTRSGKPQKSGPAFKVGKINVMSLPEINKRYQDLSSVRRKISDMKASDDVKTKLLEKQNAEVVKLGDINARAKAMLKKEKEIMAAKGYLADETLSEKDAKIAMKKLENEIKERQRDLDYAAAQNKKAEAAIVRDLNKISSGIKKKKSAKKKTAKKKPAKKKPAKKKPAKKKTAKNTPAKKKPAKSVSKRTSKKSTRKSPRRYARKRNPIEVLENPVIEILDNPKKSSKKASKKKVSKKKSSKKKVSKKKSSKKKSKKIEKDGQKTHGKKKTHSRKKASYKAKALDIKPKSKSKKTYKKTKSKNKRKMNPDKKIQGESMASKFQKGFQDVTKHNVMEASGLAVGGVALKLYNHHLKSMVVNLPGIKNLYQAIPKAAAPLFDGLFDILIASAAGHIISKATKGNETAESISKGIIGASVVSLSMKLTQSVYAGMGKEMNGFVAVPTMDGIIAVPDMEGIIAVPQMDGLGQYSSDADFGQLDNSADFGAILATPEMEGMGDADFGEYAFEDEGADF